MPGLIKYDLLQICCGVKGGFVAVYLVFIAVLSMVNDIGSIVSYMFVFVSAMFGIASFNYEETYHWDRYTAVLPVNIRQLVLARYGSIGICIAAGVVSSIVLGAISFASQNTGLDFSQWTMSFLFSLLGAMLYMELLVPIMYRFGPEKGRIIMLVLFMAFFAGLGAFGALVENAALEQLAVLDISMKYVIAGSVIAVLALLPVSVGISVSIRAKKEF